MGPPGSGKSSIARMVAKSLGMKTYDFDDDHLEKVAWGQSVASKLSELGDEEFLKAEGAAAMLITDKTHQNTVISLTGSNPLHAQAMSHLRTLGVCVYLDCDASEILQRCGQMKVDRIVGQNTMSLPDILRWRHDIYESSYDVRVIIERDESLHSIHQKILNVLSGLAPQSHAQFVSTRNNNCERKDLSAVISEGLSGDGGLFLPAHFSESLRRFTDGELQRILHDSDLTYGDVALRVLETFALDGKLTCGALRGMLKEAYAPQLFSGQTDVAPLRKLNERLFVLELFHGATASFKDMALNVFPKLFLNAFDGAANGAEPLFVVATSGDTGSSVLNGFDAADRETPVVVMYPHNGISKIQQLQIERFRRNNPRNVLVLAIEQSDFDFCQNAVKRIFDDDKFKKSLSSAYDLRYELAAANSINWARFLPQIPFYFWARKQLKKTTAAKQFDVCIPTGNFGHILGALIAKRMGCPIRKLIVATNRNCVLYDFINGAEAEETAAGTFSNESRTLKKTHSPSIDILLPSNLERYLHVIADESGASGALTRDLMRSYAEEKSFEITAEMRQRLQSELFCGKAEESECLQMIKAIYDAHNVKVDPHTAVGLHVALHGKHMADGDDEDVPMVVASTAHYSKFPEAMIEALDADDGKYAEVLEKCDYEQMFALLDGPFKSVNGMHPAISELIGQRRREEDKEGEGAQRCEANMDAVMQKIASFLRSRDDKLQNK